MANHKSAEKRQRQSIKKRARNRVAKSTVRTAVKGVRAALEQNSDAQEVKGLMQSAERLLAKAAIKGILSKSTASRNISRLAKSVAKKGKAAK